MTKNEQRLLQVFGLACGLLAVTMHYFSRDTTTAGTLALISVPLILKFRKAIP